MTRQRFAVTGSLFGTLKGAAYEHTDGHSRLPPHLRGRPDVNECLETRPRFRRTDRLRLAATATAPRCGRMFVRQVCHAWNIHGDQADSAILLTSELVSNAVEATGIVEPQPAYALLHRKARLIGIRLLEFDRSLVIEVWDTSIEPPRLVEADLDAENGRGLQLVDTLSLRWGYYYARVGGKVVWCELPLGPALPDDVDRDPVILQRVLEAFQALSWDGPP